MFFFAAWRVPKTDITSKVVRVADILIFTSGYRIIVRLVKIDTHAAPFIFEPQCSIMYSGYVKLSKAVQELTSLSIMYRSYFRL